MEISSLSIDSIALKKPEYMIGKLIKKATKIGLIVGFNQITASKITLIVGTERMILMNGDKIFLTGFSKDNKLNPSAENAPRAKLANERHKVEPRAM